MVSEAIKGLAIKARLSYEKEANQTYEGARRTAPKKSLFFLADMQRIFL
jgi:hypothetical protein